MREQAMSEQLSCHWPDAELPPFDDLLMEQHTKNCGGVAEQESEEEQLPQERQLHHSPSGDAPLSFSTFECSTHCTNESTTAIDVAEEPSQPDIPTLQPTRIESIGRPPSFSLDPLHQV